eukprot:6499707-Karenia_brevis.AAC.1
MQFDCTDLERQHAHHVLQDSQDNSGVDDVTLYAKAVQIIQCGQRCDSMWNRKWIVATDCDGMRAPSGRTTAF